MGPHHKKNTQRHGIGDGVLLAQAQAQTQTQAQARMEPGGRHRRRWLSRVRVPPFLFLSPPAAPTWLSVPQLATYSYTPAAGCSMLKKGELGTELWIEH